MLKINGEEVKINRFPDGTLLMKQRKHYGSVTITWLFESNEELVALIFLVGHLREKGVEWIFLEMPYIPNARQDRVQELEDVFTLKYFANTINMLNFDGVMVADPHSYTSCALINKVQTIDVGEIIIGAISKNEHMYEELSEDNLRMFFPDEGSMKRYSKMFEIPYTYGLKVRDWKSGKIQGLNVIGEEADIKGRTILIVDDICSKGGTFYHSAKKLKELGAGKIYLYVTHCENTILNGKLIDSGLIEKVFTTNSIFTKKHDKIDVEELW